MVGNCYNDRVDSVEGISSLGNVHFVYYFNIDSRSGFCMVILSSNKVSDFIKISIRYIRDYMILIVCCEYISGIFHELANTLNLSYNEFQWTSIKLRYKLYSLYWNSELCFTLKFKIANTGMENIMVTENRNNATNSLFLYRFMHYIPP